MAKEVNVDIKTTSPSEIQPESGDNSSAVPEQNQPQINSYSKPLKRPKPLVEGINSPTTTAEVSFVKPQLTEKEEELISEEPRDLKQEEPRLMPRQILNRKHHHLAGILRTGVILLIIVGAAYEFYIWQLSNSVSQSLRNIPIPQPPISNTLQSSNATTATSSLLTVIATSTLGSSSTSPTSTTMTATSTFPLAGGTPPPPASVTQLTINSTPTNYLNVRSEPSISGQLISQVHPGETYTYTATQNGWYQIVLNNGQSGWVSGQYVTVQK
jgi:hypothetical protein